VFDDENTRTKRRGPGRILTFLCCAAWLLAPMLVICWMIYASEGINSPYYAGLNLVMAVFLLAVVGMAESPAGMVESRGNVSINGKAVSESSNLFNDDRIQTAGADSGASILANGQHVMVMGNSIVIYRD